MPKYFQDRYRKARVILLGAIILLLFIGCTIALTLGGSDAPNSAPSAGAPNSPSPETPEETTPAAIITETTSPAPAPPPRDAQAMLNDLEVKEDGGVDGFDVDLFVWVDYDENGCLDSDDVYRRDLVDIYFAEGSSGCIVESGVPALPYDDPTDSRWFRDREHARRPLVFPGLVVSPADAWRAGASDWNSNKRLQFTNDPLNLVAGSYAFQHGHYPLYGRLSDKNECELLARRVAILDKYELAIDERNKESITNRFSECPDQPVFKLDVNWPKPGEGDVGSGPAPSEPAPGDSHDNGGSSDGTNDSHAYYSNCAAARAAGAAPIYRGEAGYRSGLDRDNDGIACE